ncbi:MAG TPA: DUF433 domain-containing protein [Planctomycetaceae bacterium]|nr:DUF433 domain-containing protein [Planctomycetaceae bacterium]
MTDEELLDRIVVNPKVMVGKPVIRGTRLTVECILNALAHEMTVDEILTEYPRLTRDDILACLLFAKTAMSDITYMPLIAEAETV